LLVTTETCPSALVWLLIRAHTRELAVRAITVGATPPAEVFVLAGAGCEFVWATIEAARAQPNKMEKTVFFIRIPWKKMKPPMNRPKTG
jgi:hypothetical protein